MKRLILIVAMLLAAQQSYAETKKVYDPLGRAHLVDKTTEMTPGAGSGLGAIIGDAVDSSLTFVRHDLDAYFMVGPQGSNDEAIPARALAGFGAMYYVNETMSLGLQIAKPNLSEGGLWEIRPEFEFLLGYDYTDNSLHGLKFSPGGYTIGTDSEHTGSSWSGDPTLLFTYKIPMKYGMIGGEGGVGYAFTQFDEQTKAAFLQMGLVIQLFVVRAGGVQ